MIETIAIILIALIVLWYAMPVIRVTALLILVVIILMLIEAFNLVANMGVKKDGH